MCNNKVDPLNKSFADKQGVPDVSTVVLPNTANKQGVPDVSTVVPPNTAVLGTGEKCKCSPLLSGPFSR